MKTPIPPTVIIPPKIEEIMSKMADLCSELANMNLVEESWFLQGVIDGLFTGNASGAPGPEYRSDFNKGFRPAYNYAGWKDLAENKS